MEIEDPANVTSKRFVLLRHEMPAKQNRQSHWDLMVEVAASLLTFELTSLPTSECSSVGSIHQARRLPDHRLAYLEYEGELSEARGSVRRIARGEAMRGPGRSTTSIRYVLASKELQAEFEFDPASLDYRRTDLIIFRWQLTTA